MSCFIVGYLIRNVVVYNMGILARCLVCWLLVGERVDGR